MKSTWRIEKKKITSEMEAAPWYELLTLLTFLPPLTLLTLFEQLQSEKAMMLIHMIWVSFGVPLKTFG